MGKKKETKKEMVEERCNCINGGECTCGDNCTCGDDCKCGRKCTCKKMKKSTSLIICLVLIVVVFCIGLGVGTFILEGNSDDRCVDVNDNKKSEDEYIVNLFNEKNENYRDISLKNEEDIKRFISQFSWMGNFEIRNDFFTGNYYLDYVIGYILASYDWLYGDNDVIYVSKDFLESEVNKVFDYSFENVLLFGTEIMHGGMTYNISCDYDDLCKIYTIPGGGTRQPFYEVIINDKKEISDGFVYTIKEYYLESGEKDDECFIKTEKNGIVLSKSNNGCSDFDSSSLDYNKLNTYEMTFDKNNKFVSSKKIN